MLGDISWNVWRHSLEYKIPPFPTFPSFCSPSLYSWFYTLLLLLLLNVDRIKNIYSKKIHIVAIPLNDKDYKLIKVNEKKIFTKKPQIQWLEE